MLTSFIDKIGDKVRWGYLTAFLLLLVSYILTFYSSQQVSNQQQQVHHTTTVINTLDILLSELKDAESAARGYIIVRNERFLNDYYKTIPFIDSTYLKLKTLTKENRLQQKQLDTLQWQIRNKLSIMERGIGVTKNTKFIAEDTVQKLASESKLIMDSIKVFATNFQSTENDLVTRKSNRVSNLSNFIKVINAASIVIAIVLAFYSISTFTKENDARQAADIQAEEFRKELEQRVNELAKLNTELLELRSIEKFAVTGRISRTIAHEVRNPLTNINLATEHLRSEIPAAAETDMLFNMITRNSNRINELINDLLNSTKTAQLNFEPVKINDILDQSIGFAQDRLDLKEIKIIKRYADNLPQVMVDVEKINIAFLNLIVNAIEAMDPGKGILTISTEHKNDRCIVTISDNGLGMDKESLSKLFEPYFTTKETGTGLGLTNTQNIILSHKANIYAESEAGKGSSFIISFNCV